MNATTMGLTRASAERRFYGAITVAMLVTVFVGFARSFFLRPLFPAWPAPAEPVFYVHGVVFTAWFLLLVAQAQLVRAGRTDLHRGLGAAGVVLAASMVVLGVLGALVAANRPTGFVGVPVPPLQFLIVPMLDMVVFAAFFATAVVKRRESQSHKRWMLLASTSVLTAAIARWPGVLEYGPLAFFAVTDLFIVALAAWDLKSRGRLHPATLVGGLVLIASQPLRLALAGTPAWLAFAAWATALVA
jgi:uncharacterized membrane protein YozB (DUF420 family)